LDTGEITDEKQTIMAFPHDGKKFEKGKSGNPDGRPKSLPDIKDVLIDALGEEQNGVTALKAIVLSLRNKALKGDVKSCLSLIEMYYGKPKQTVEQKFDSNEPLVIVLSSDSSDES
jgi:hypothetical protein